MRRSVHPVQGRHNLRKSCHLFRWQLAVMTHASGWVCLGAVMFHDVAPHWGGEGRVGEGDVGLFVLLAPFGSFWTDFKSEGSF